MTADVEMKTLVARGARDASDIHGIELEHCDRDVVLRQQITSRQTRRSCADDSDRGFHWPIKRPSFPV